MNEELIKEIESMEESITADDDGVEDPIKDPDVPVEDPPVVDDPPKVEDPPPKDPPTDPPIEDPPAEDDPPIEDDPPVEDPPIEPTEMDNLRDEIKELKALIPKKKEDPPIEEPLVKEPELPEEHNFLKDLDLDELTRDPEAFNKLLNNVFLKGVELTRAEVKSGSEGLLRSIPDIVKNNIQVTTALKKASDEFYSDNEDLKPFKKVVAVVFEEIASKNPDKSYKEILVEVEKDTRKRLELHKKAVVDNKDKDKDKDKDVPKLPGNKGSKRTSKQKPDTSSLAKELADMDEVVDS